jgi:hypothetical protein
VQQPGPQDIPSTPVTIPADIARFALAVLADSIEGPKPFGNVYYADQKGAHANLTRVLDENPDADTVTVRARTVARAADAIGTYERLAPYTTEPMTNKDWERIAAAQYSVTVLRTALADSGAPHRETWYHPDMEVLLP